MKIALVLLLAENQDGSHGQTTGLYTPLDLEICSYLAFEVVWMVSSKIVEQFILGCCIF